VTWRGAFSGALALIALEAVVRSNTSAGRVGQLLEDVAGIVRRVLDPTVAAIPDLRGAGHPENPAHVGPPGYPPNHPDNPDNKNTT
jgi:hypothetical protein